MCCDRDKNIYENEMARQYIIVYIIVPKENYFFKLLNELLRSFSPIKPNEGWSSRERFKGVL